MNDSLKKIQSEEQPMRQASPNWRCEWNGELAFHRDLVFSSD